MYKILVIHTKYRITGGEDIAVENEVSILKKNYEIETLYFSNKETRNPFTETLNIILNRNKLSKELLIKKIEEFRPNLVYVHNTWFKGSLSIFNVLKKLNVSYVIKLHNFRFDCGRYITIRGHLKNNDICKACGLKKNNSFIFNKYYQDSFLKSFMSIIYNKKYYKILKKSKIFTLTNFQKSFLLNNGFDQNNVKTLTNPSNKSFEKLNKQNFEFTPNSYLIYAGLISEEKGVEELIETYNLLSDYDKKLLIVGEGPELNRIKKMNKNENIVFTGKMENSDVLHLISNSYSVITNTTLFEGQPNLLSEASKLGINSIYPDSGGISEFFPMENPFAFKPSNRIELLKKLKLTKHEDIVRDQAEKNKIYFDKNFTEEKYFENFDRYIEWLT